MPNDFRPPLPQDRPGAPIPSGATANSIHFRSPAELAAYTRYDRLARTGPLLLARHAGGHPDGTWPGSALESAQHLLATRARTMIEVDLRTTVDGRCVVLHDPVLGTVSTGAGPVTDQSADYVLTQHLLDNYGEVTPFEIREAADFLAWAARAGAVLWLNVHGAPPELVAELVRAHGAESQVVVGVAGRTELAAYRRAAPELVCFVPPHPDGLLTVEDIRQEAADLERVIGFAGDYVPDMEASLRMHAWNVPLRLDLHRYDEVLPADAVDPRYYRRAVETGFRILSTAHYREVADLLGLREWAPAAEIRDPHGTRRS